MNSLAMLSSMNSLAPVQHGALVHLELHFELGEVQVQGVLVDEDAGQELVGAGVLREVWLVTGHLVLLSLPRNANSFQCFHSFCATERQDIQSLANSIWQLETRNE